MARNPVISPEYAALNRQLHNEMDTYGAAAARDAAGVVKVARQTGCNRILDFGCGKGSLKPAIYEIAPEMVVLEFDPAIPGKENMPAENVDLVAAMDVMEHIELEYLDNVLTTMCSLNPKIVLMKISLRPADKNLPDGRNAHILLKPIPWWKERLAPYFKTRHTQETADVFVFIGKPLAKDLA
jgi:hypothetical protein